MTAPIIMNGNPRNMVFKRNSLLRTPPFLETALAYNLSDIAPATIDPEVLPMPPAK